jgi:hypothetical protein
LTGGANAPNVERGAAGALPRQSGGDHDGADLSLISVLPAHCCPVIQLHALGSVDLRRQGGTRSTAVVAQPKRLVLLAYLALVAARGSVRRDTLVATFWPELDAEHARGFALYASKVIGTAAAALGDSTRARRELALLLAPDTSRHAPTALRLAAEVAARLGEHERAISLLKDAFAKGEPFTFWLHLSPAFEPLRERPDYREITKLRN